MTRRLVAALACRNQGSRLYGKPLQNLDIERGTRILDHILDCLGSVECIDEVVLGIAAGVENKVFRRVAEEKGIRYVVGDEVDVLARLIACGQLAGATDIFRMTSESPFLYYEAVEEAWDQYVREGADALFLDDLIDGCGFEILSLKSLETSHAKGESKHRSELCTLYIREHHEDFKTLKPAPPPDLIRRDLRLTVDYPEDLAICRAVYGVFRAQAPRIPVSEIVRFLDANPKLIDMISPYAEEGYKSMFVWGRT